MKTSTNVTPLWLTIATSFIALVGLVYAVDSLKGNVLLYVEIFIINFLLLGIPHESLHKWAYWLVNKDSKVKIVIFSFQKRVIDESDCWYTKSQMTTVLLMPLIISLLLGIGTIFFDSSTFLYNFLFITMMCNTAGMIPGDIRDVINMFFIEEYKHFTEFKYLNGKNFSGR